MIRSILFCGFLAAFGLPALAQPAVGGWKVSTTTNKMDGAKSTSYSRTATVAIKDSLGGASKPTIVLRCKREKYKPGEVDLRVEFGSRLFTSIGDNTVRTRIDEGEVEERNWGNSTDQTALFWYRPDMKALSVAKQLHVEFAPPLNTRQYTSFNFTGADKVIEALVEACSLSGDELVEHDRRAIESLRKHWLQALAAPGYSGGYEYQNAYRLLSKADMIKAADLTYRDSNSRPLADEQLVDGLLEFMKARSHCLIGLNFPQAWDHGNSGACPSTMRTYGYVSGYDPDDPKPLDNRAWNMRWMLLGEPAMDAAAQGGQ